MSREKKLLFNSFILVLGTFLPRLINFFTTPLITANTTTLGYDTITLTTSTVISMIVPVISMQIEQAIYRFLIDAKSADEQKTAITTGISYIFAIMAVVIIVGTLLPIPVFGGVWKLVLIVYVLSEIMACQSRFVLRGFSKYRQYSFQAALIVILNFVFILITLVGFDLGYGGVVLSLTLANVFGILYVVLTGKIYQYYRFKYFNGDILKKMLQYSFPFLPNNIAWYINTTSDRWLLKIFVGGGAAGIYQASNIIPSLVNLIYPAFNMAWMESAIKSVDDDDREIYYRKMFRILFRLLAAGSVALMIIAPLLYRILIRNSELYEGFVYTSLLIGAVFIYSLAQFLGSIYVALKKTRNMTISTTISAVINALINLALMPFFGFEIAVYSTFISNASLLAYRVYDLNRNSMVLTIKPRQIIFTVVTMLIVGYAMVSTNLIFIAVGVVAGLFFIYVMALDLIIDFVKKVLKIN